MLAGEVIPAPRQERTPATPPLSQALAAASPETSSLTGGTQHLTVTVTLRRTALHLTPRTAPT
ncbi:MAG: hypothetical protein M3Z75_28665 [Actinomycetota bacterium]|nr:hypothetical protein [Actinomycetota bacterium]